MINTIIDENNVLLADLGSCTGDMARLAHRLSETSKRLQAVLDQANAQFNAGDKHATFNKQTIAKLSERMSFCEVERSYKSPDLIVSTGLSTPGISITSLE